jgi:phospholipase C
MRRALQAVLIAVVCLGAAGITPAFGSPAGNIHDIQHVIVVMQENRSFDSYFGTYPGANGIPAGTCVPDPLHGSCVVPFHNPADKNYGGPHGHDSFLSDLDEGKMDGFIGTAESGFNCSSTAPGCSPCKEEQAGSGAQCVDVMGYHDAREIPNYWTYAENYVLQDNMYEPNSSWSWPEHLFLVSGWSAVCKNWSDPLSCSESAPGGPPTPDQEPDPYTGPEAISLPWTDVTYMLHKHSVSWAYYLFEGTEPDCESDEAVVCAPVKQGPKTKGIWNPLVDFMDVKEDGQLENIRSINSFYNAAHATSTCALPKVSWIIPSYAVSEHPEALVSNGQAYVTTVINSIMRSPCWDSSAIFLSWDDWGGFYDHVPPPVIDGQGYGFRVPGLVISPFAKAGYIDRQQLSHDAYLKFIEDDFLAGERLNPKTDGRPDSRADVREEAPGLGNLLEDFNFDQPPRPPLILPTHPAPGPASNPPGYVPPAPPPVAAKPSVPVLQLVASVAPRQDLRRQHGNVELTLSCNVECDLFAYGHLNVRRQPRRHPHRHVGLRPVHKALAAHQAQLLKLWLSPARLAAVRRALHQHHRVYAWLTVEGAGPARQHQRYEVRVRLEWR